MDVDFSGICNFLLSDWRCVASFVVCWAANIMFPVDIETGLQGRTWDHV